MTTLSLFSYLYYIIMLRFFDSKNDFTILFFIAGLKEIFTIAIIDFHVFQISFPLARSISISLKAFLEYLLCNKWGSWNADLWQVWQILFYWCVKSPHLSAIHQSYHDINNLNRLFYQLSKLFVVIICIVFVNTKTGNGKNSFSW